jgi:hypothetical protein
MQLQKVRQLLGNLAVSPTQFHEHLKTYVLINALYST